MIHFKLIANCWLSNVTSCEVSVVLEGHSVSLWKIYLM